MDELDAIQAVLDQALVKAKQAGAKRITDLHLALGEISNYTPESVQAGWRQLARGTPAAGAKLHFRRVQAEVQCMACFTKYRPERGEIVCPNCGSVGARILAGEEFFIEAVDLE